MLHCAKFFVAQCSMLLNKRYQIKLFFLKFFLFWFLFFVFWLYSGRGWRGWRGGARVGAEAGSGGWAAGPGRGEEEEPSTEAQEVGQPAAERGGQSDWRWDLFVYSTLSFMPHQTFIFLEVLFEIRNQREGSIKKVCF